MDIRHTALVSNPPNWELTYKESSRKESYGSMIGAFVISAVAWPLFALICPCGLYAYANAYFKTISKQAHAVKVLSNPNTLERYSEQILSKNARAIIKQKLLAISVLEKMHNFPSLGLPLPSQQGHFNNAPTEALWRNFPWEEFIKKDFLSMSRNVKEAHFQRDLELLEQSRLRLQFLLHQKTVLTDLSGETRLDAVRKIAEISFVRNGFKRQEAKEGIGRVFIWFLPTGMFWNLSFGSNERLTFEGKKEFLTGLPNANRYNDLVDAHNQLIKNHDYLVPYFPRQFA